MIKVLLDTNVVISALLKEGSAPAMVVSLDRDESIKNVGFRQNFRVIKL